MLLCPLAAIRRIAQAMQSIAYIYLGGL